MRYLAFLHTDETGGWGISFPDFPGCISDGDTVDEALARGESALGVHVESMRERGQAVPPPRPVEAILADADLAEWRGGAQFAHVPLFVDAGAPKRLNISLDAGLLAAIDAEAERRKMTRSAFLATAARGEIRAAH